MDGSVATSKSKTEIYLTCDYGYASQIVQL